MDVDVVEVATGVHHARAAHVGWVLVTDGDEVTLVDSGYPGDRERVVRSFERIGRSPADLSAVVLTHGHVDHIGSAEWLRATHGVPVLVHELEAANARGEHVEQVSEATLLRLMWRRDVRGWVRDILRLRANKPERPAAVSTFREDRLDVPGRPVPVLTPGHTSGHCSLHLPDRGVLIAGDALMTAHAVARDEGPQLMPDVFNVDTARARASLQAIADLAADVVVPGHGPAWRGGTAQAVRAALAHP